MRVVQAVCCQRGKPMTNYFIVTGRKRGYNNSAQWKATGRRLIEGFPGYLKMKLANFRVFVTSKLSQHCEYWYKP
ncbi:hypothetical protein WJ978_30075 [Achromobacter xylosoxidans]